MGAMLPCSERCVLVSVRRASVPVFGRRVDGRPLELDMADVKVIKAHSLSSAEAQQRMQSFEEMLTKYGVKSKWKGNHADLKGVGVTGSIDVSDQDVTVVVKLGMLAKAAGVDADRLGKSIDKRLSSALG